MGAEESGVVPEEQPKKPRHRKKHLYNTILQQMEFYFSDSNLSKDRFLSQLLSESPDVAIEVFLKFNKIRKLNCSVEDIQKAIKKSDLIGLSEDGQKIHRNKPVKVKENVDFCTIYVENIKSDATHESLSQIFSDFGNVMYVSIPKFKHNKANKGFSFIEYETEEQAHEAVSFFESIGCKIPADKNPEELQSIATFEGDQRCTEIEKPKTVELANRKNGERESNSEKEPKVNIKRRNSSVSDKGERKNSETKTNENKIQSKTEKEPEEHAKKRKLSVEEKDANKKSKKTRTEENEVKSRIGKEPEEHIKKRKLRAEEKDINKKHKTNSESQTDEKAVIEKKKTDRVEEEIASDELGDTKKKKKNKKEKRKNYIKELGMQVLSKKEWKKLRNTYLDLQKKKMREFKRYLYKQRFGPKRYHEEQEEVEEQAVEQKESKEILDEVNKLSYTPGVIVKVKLPEPCSDVKTLKNEIKSISPEVKYVDIPLPAGSEEVFIRFGNKEAASDFCNTEFDGAKTVIDGDEEKHYWEKIENDRTVKFRKVAKKQRGRDKLLKRAEKESAKHTRFEDGA